MISLEIENDGQACKTAKINGVDIGTRIYAIDLHIEGGQKPIAIFTCRLDELKINGLDIQPFKKIKRLGRKKKDGNNI